MQDHPVLGQVALGYSPMIDRQRAVVATRLTVFPERPDAAPPAAALLAALAEVWPAPAPAAPTLSLQLRPLDPAAVKARAAAAAAPPLVLNLAGEALLQAVMAAEPGQHLMLEVPAFMVAQPQHQAGLQALMNEGCPLLIKGRPLQALPPALLAGFAHALVEAGDDGRAQAAGAGAATTGLPRELSFVQAGVRTLAGVEAAFQRGAVATLGWPLDDAVQPVAGRKAVAQDVQVVLELIAGVDREAPVPQLEATLKKDPTLAFRLMRYLNSPAFGLSVEINSFGHALMMLGYERLKRWLALLLASSAQGAAAKPLMFAAVRRGLLMEELLRSSGDSELRGEVFICGVFSLLDRLLQLPFAELFKSVPVSERVRQALLNEDGPFQPYLELVRAIEAESLFDIREQGEKLFLTPLEINHALLRALAAARALD
jgi:EAL and modified HD-GYP domain-containing signal transduction protein